MIEWFLIIDLHYTSQKIAMGSKSTCVQLLQQIYNPKTLYDISGVFCINTKTGELVEYNED